MTELNRSSLNPIEHVCKIYGGLTSFISRKTIIVIRPLECVAKNYFFYLSTKTFVVGTQKNRLNEAVLLSTQNIC